MKPDDVWKLFSETGDINYYLLYRAAENKSENRNTAEKFIPPR